MFKTQIVIFAVIGIISCDKLINSNRWVSDRIDRRPETATKSLVDSLLIDSAQVIVRVGNIIRDTASTNEIIANRGLRIILKGYPSDFRIAVLGFYITTVNKNNDTLAVDVGTRGNLLSKNQIDELRKLNGYGKVIFHGIRAVAVSGTVIALPPFSLTVRK